MQIKTLRTGNYNKLIEHKWIRNEIFLYSHQDPNILDNRNYNSSLKFPIQKIQQFTKKMNKMTIKLNQL